MKMQPTHKHTPISEEKEYGTSYCADEGKQKMAFIVSSPAKQFGKNTLFGRFLQPSMGRFILYCYRSIIMCDVLRNGCAMSERT